MNECHIWIALVIGFCISFSVMAVWQSKVKIKELELHKVQVELQILQYKN